MMLRREWIAACLAAMPGAAQHAHEQMQRPLADRKLLHLTPAEAKIVEAVASEIIPSEESSPGAREAGAVYFIDALLSDAALLREYRQNLPAYEHTSSELLRRLENTPFFETIRRHTVMAVFSDPRYGGNFDHTGWNLIGLEDRMGFAPPFGYYDANLPK